MESGRWRQIEQLYHAALEREASQRASFLEQSCAADPSLRQEVESLLSVADDADGYLKAAVHDATPQVSGVSTAAPSRHDLPPIPRTLGRYEILEQVGKGGMGVVYRAVDPAIGRIVAIKTIRFDDAAEEKNSELRARLLRESQAGGQLSHPNIVAVYDVSEQGETAYIVMEYVVGRTLDQAMSEGLSLRSSEEALRIVEACAGALDYAHSRGIVHRDIKPANIMLQVDGGVKIADFGIAKAAQFTPLTQSAVMVGSPHYMAPEQWKGEAVTGRADQYALAGVAYAMLTGRRPFVGETLASLAAKTLYEDPPAATTLNPALNLAVDAVFRKALSKNGAARYDTCGQFVAALRVACQATPTASFAAPSPLQAPRRPNWLAAAAVVCVLAALGGGAWLYQRDSAAKLEIAYWTSIQDSQTRAPFEAYLKRYPGGQFAGPAAAQLAAINNERSPDPHPQTPAKPPQPSARKDAARIADTSRRESVRSKVAPDEPLAGGDPYAEGNALLKRGEYAKAVPYFSKAIAVKPEYRAFFGRAGAYQNLERMELAIEDYTQAIRLNPASAMAYHDRAVCLARLKENDRALADYNRALELASDNPLTWNGRGVIYLRRKEYQKAIPDFTMAIHLRPTFAQPYENRAAAKKALGDVAGANADLSLARGLKQ
jgi:serine/threonine protein kinase/Flp pilus assembly protein TadD